MKLPLSALFLTACGLVHSNPTPRAAKPPRFFLIGDSTVAVNGGWGDGLLSYLKAPAEGDNRGVSGSTTVSWKSSGRWDALLKDVGAAKNDFEPVVTIQFGHNDQKVMQLDEFHSNLVSIGNDIKKAGGTPIFITSLTRRTFSGGEVVQNLKDWAAETISAAADVGGQYLELNKASTDYINAIGSQNADFYNWGPGDRTHLNPPGEIVFGRMVVDLLLEKRGDFSSYFDSNEALSEKIKKGEFATGDE
ncbi:hypothetical protein NW768_002446 [Fusarium equiseti]|uniref:SGNH hydrolase-type esterase domain-containing protein n=1 Tax=Fusarium equiseti TaxID=61235 RepID=A0ABQ8RNH0_FUSEQ|nr:hypothetical protein NW768_002446 [Fusarium equiseti]